MLFPIGNRKPKKEQDGSTLGTSEETHYELGQEKLRKGDTQSGWEGEVVRPLPWAAATKERRKAVLRTIQLRTHSCWRTERLEGKARN